MENVSKELLVSTSGSSNDLKFWGLLMVIFIIIGSFGNMIVIIVIAKNRRLQNAQNIYIASLALGDFIICAFVMPFTVYEVICNQKWYLGDILCRIWTSVDLITTIGTIWNLCLLTADRLIAVKKPFAYAAKVTRFKAYISVLCVWVCAILVTSPIIAFLEISDNQLHLCSIKTDNGYRIFAAFLTFHIPCLFISTMNCCIFQVAKKSNKRNRVGPIFPLNRSSSGNAPMPSISGGVQTSSVNTISGNLRSRRSESIFFARERKSAFVMSMFSLSFIICWLPYSLFLFWVGISPQINDQIPPLVPVLLRWLGLMNSFINCFLYGILKRDLQVHVRKLFRNTRIFT